MTTPLSTEIRQRLQDSFIQPEASLDTPTPSSGLDKASSLTVQVGGGHYKKFSIQPVEFITANGLSFLEGCVIKRMCRHSSKNGVEDLRKAIHEIQLLAELTYGVQL